MPKTTNEIIDELVEIGNRYLRKRQTFFGFNIHTHQDLANYLSSLNKKQISDTGGLAHCVCSKFLAKNINKESSLLRSVVNCFAMSRAFPKLNDYIKQKTQAIAKMNAGTELSIWPIADSVDQYQWGLAEDLKAMQILTAPIKMKQIETKSHTHALPPPQNYDEPIDGQPKTAISAPVLGT